LGPCCVDAAPDLKPANILIGDDGRIRVCDMGLAQSITTKTSFTVGTVYYSPPESRLNAVVIDSRNYGDVLLS
jgi:serine/threonine protein kinase